MQYIKCDVSTICIGQAVFMGAFLLAAGAKGKRFALPNADVMIHQPLGGAQGQAEDIIIQAEKIKSIRQRMNLSRELSPVELLGILPVHAERLANTKRKAIIFLIFFISFLL